MARLAEEPPRAHDGHQESREAPRGDALGEEVHEMRKNMRFYGRPSTFVVLRDRDEILLDKNTGHVIDREELPGEGRLVRLGVALREVESARRFRSQFDGLAR